MTEGQLQQTRLIIYYHLYQEYKHGGKKKEGKGGRHDVAPVYIPGTPANAEVPTVTCPLVRHCPVHLYIFYFISTGIVWQGESGLGAVGAQALSPWPYCLPDWYHENKVKIIKIVTNMPPRLATKAGPHKSAWMHSPNFAAR